MCNYKVLVLPGDGIGVEVIDAAISVLNIVSDIANISIDIEFDLIGGACYEQHNTFIRDQTVERAKAVDAILVGAEGGPDWDNLPIEGGPCAKSGLSRLRKELDLFANIRPIKYWPKLLASTPYREDVISKTDLVIVRELTGGIYFGEPRGISIIDNQRVGVDTNRYSETEIARVAHSACKLARKRSKYLCSVDKANVMESGVLCKRSVEDNLTYRLPFI